MYKFLLIGVAGLVGTLARVWFADVIGEWWNGRFPIGTVIVNLVGCFAIGFLFHLTQDRYVIDPVLRSALLVGVLGGFTTFSSYGLQVFTSFQEGEVFLAMANVLISNIVGLLMVWAGYAVSRTF
jgi:CrcB protein